MDTIFDYVCIRVITAFNAGIPSELVVIEAEDP